MRRQDFIKKALPDAPGVYFFLGKSRKVLYIGRATSLRERVKSYFSANLIETRGLQVVDMVAKAGSLDFKKTDSVLEAILLEADLIKKFQPPYNIKEKDDKSFNCVAITSEDFPRVLIVRKKDIDSSFLKTANCKLQSLFGPFPHGARLKDALKIIRKIFPYRDDKCRPNHGKPCFNKQIGLCPGVCTGEISKTDYAAVICRIELFFSCKKTRLLKNLERRMKVEAEAKNFEKAGAIKKTLFAIQHIQDVGLVKSSRDNLRAQKFFRIEAFDVAHISGAVAVGAMAVVEDGLAKKSDYRKFRIRGGFGNNDTASLREVVKRRLAHQEWPMPEFFVADGGLAQKGVIEAVLKAGGFSVPVVAVTKNEYHRPEKILGDESLVQAHEKAILLANNEAHRFAVLFHRSSRRRLFKNFNNR